MKENIGKIFKEGLQSEEATVSFEEMELMNRLLLKNSFYQFSPFTFNVFYAAAIVSGFLITMTLAGHYIYTQSLIAKITKLEEPKVPIIEKTNEIQGEYSEKGTFQPVPSPSLVNSSVSKEMKEENLDAKQNNTFLNDSIATVTLIADQPIQPHLPKDSAKKVSNPLKKTVVIVKNDTIYQMDTITKKPSKRRKK